MNVKNLTLAVIGYNQECLSTYKKLIQIINYYD